MKTVSVEQDDKQTPLIKQYFSIVNQYPGAIVLMRVGDFYETYGDIAVETSKLLGITLTKRSNGSSSKMSNLPLSGFPYHALDSYLSKLIQYGYKVAICDQLEDPAKAKGLVKRGVTEFITPGLITTDSVLNKKQNNYLGSLYFENNKVGIAFLDFSTGEFSTTEGDTVYIQKLLDSFSPNEIIFSKMQEQELTNLLDIKKELIIDKHKLNTGLQDWVFKEQYAVNLLTNHFGSVNIKGLGLEDMSLAIIASGAILQYLKDTGHENIDHITSISRIKQDKYMWLDKFTIKNLELINPQHENGTSLIDILDETVTSMGGRKLKKWLLLPLKNLDDIKSRQNFVTMFYNNENLGDRIFNELKNIIDLERITSKMAMKKVVPKDFIALHNSLKSIKTIKDILDKSLKITDCVLYECEELTSKIFKTIVEDSTQSNFIKADVNEELDEYKYIKENSNNQLKELLRQEIAKTGITTLKIGYNKIYGYYFEVTNSHLDKVPSEWIRKQTLTNGERFINEYLKIFEEKILNADTKITELENGIFNELIDYTLKYTKHLLHNANIIADLDCYINLAKIAKKYKYCCPNVNEGHKIDIKNGRHPVIERKLAVDNYYVPNNIFLDDEKQQIMLITGPNMAGKSALLREVALIVLMAQLGSYVPASNAEIGIVDKIFTRVGATDNLSTGESTFMMEMNETANIMHNLSDRSLVIMDEIGRGTSTYDGISIAWAILEYLHNSKYRPKTLFATHYHELSDLENILERLFNFSLSVWEKEDKIIFVRKLEKKKCEHSFGINVAKISGIPNPIIDRAKEILDNLEKSAIKISDKGKLNICNVKQIDKENEKLKRLKQFFDAIDENKISPLDALIQIHDLKKIIKKL